MPTPQDKSKDWAQINFRVPKQYKAALKELSAKSGLNIEEICANAIGDLLGKPIDPEQHRYARKKAKEIKL